MGFKFEELIVWQKALDLTEEIHNLTLQFPADEKYIITSQIKRAADSIALNIAEGSTGQSNAEFSKFLGYAIRSGIEVISCLHICKRRKLINTAVFDELYENTTVIVKMTQALKNKIK